MPISRGILIIRLGDPLNSEEEFIMKLLKRMAVLSLVVLALGGCTKSSISTDAPVSGSEEIDPAKMETDDDDETLPRDQNFLVEDETVETTMYDWDQAQNECDGLFNDTSAFPQSKDGVHLR